MKETYYISHILHAFNQQQLAFSINSRSTLGHYTTWRYGKNGSSIGKTETHDCNAAHSGYGVGEDGGVCYIMYLPKPIGYNSNI